MFCALEAGAKPPLEHFIARSVGWCLRRKSLKSNDDGYRKRGGCNGLRPVHREDTAIVPPLQAPSEASAWQDGARFYPAAFALCALVLALTAPMAPGAGVISAAVIGGLFVMHRTALSLTIVAALMVGVFLVPGASGSSAYWSDLAIVIIAALFPRRLAPALLQAPRWSWLFGMALGTAGLCLHFLLPGIAGQAAIVVGSLCAAFIGAGIARHVAVVDARLLAWGDRGMV